MGRKSRTNHQLYRRAKQTIGPFSSVVKFIDDSALSD